MQTIRQRTALSRAAANDPRIERATYHRDPQWIEGPTYDPERLVGWVLKALIVGLVLLSLAGEYGPVLIAGVL